MADPSVVSFTSDGMLPLVNHSMSSWGNGSNRSTDAPDSYWFDEEAWAREQHIYFILEVVTVVCYCITMLVGTIGNVLVIYTIWRCRHLHTVMYTLLASLAIADLIIVLILLPWRLKTALYVGSWVWGEFMCRFPGYAQLLCAISSIFHLTAISMERCYAVMFPLKSRTKLTIGNAYKIIAAVWIAAAIFSVPHLFSVAVNSIEIRGTIYKTCRLIWKEEHRQAYALYLFFVVFAIPMLQITGSYVFIIRTLYIRRASNVCGKKNGSIALNQSRRYQTGSTRNGNNGAAAAPRTSSVYIANNTSKLNRSTTRNKESEIRQVTAMLIVVIVLFAICWGPMLTFTVISRFCLGDAKYEQKWIIVSSAFHLMTMMNSAWNPIIYALMSASFRDSCRWALQVCCKPRSVQRRMSAMSRATTVSRPGISAGGGSTAYDNVSESSLGAGDKL